MKYFYWFQRAPGFRGICLRVHGKFKGMLRKRRFILRLGKSSVQELKVRVDYSYQQSFTRFGVFAIKVWLFYK